MSKTVTMLLACILSTHFLPAAMRNVNSTSDDPNSIGSLPYWLLNANDGDTIDCSLIAGQTITLSASLPAITKSYTINGAGITIDGDGAYQAFQVASGNSTITALTIQNTLSKGGDGGSGYSGGGGGVGGGGALYLHGDTSLTLSASTLLNNRTQGGNGGDADNNGNAGGGGGGGFGGGNGGSALNLVSTGGGGGGHSSGGDGGSSSNKNGSNGIYFGGGGGGAGINIVSPGGYGGNAFSFIGGQESGGNGGGGAGSSQNGFDATGSGTSSSPGNGGNGIGSDFLFGAGGGGGCSSETGFAGATGIGAAGGGGGSNYSGGEGGILGGGGGGGVGGPGGEGGFGAGGGGAIIGGIGGGGFAAGGGNGGSDPGANSGGGGGSALGGAIFVQTDAELILIDAQEISGNSALAGIGGSSTSSSDPGYIAAGNGAAMGQDIFLRQGASLTFDLSNTLTIAHPIEGDNLSTPVNISGSLRKKGTGTLELNGENTYIGTTTIESGNLRLNGSIEGDLFIETDGALLGNATIGGNIHNSGTISGTIYTKNLILSPTSTYRVEVSPSQANLIQASETASLDGIVHVVQVPGNYPSKGKYKILTTTGGLSGSINDLVVDALPGFQFSLEKGIFTLSLSYVKLSPAPSNARGRQARCKNGFVNILKWDPPEDEPSPLYYYIYRNDLKTRIGKVGANDKLEYKDEKRSACYTYYIVAIDQQHRASAPAKITIDPA